MFPPPSQSYYCLLKVNSEDAEGEERQYLVCFLSIGKEGLDLYPHNQNLITQYYIGHWIVGSLYSVDWTTGLDYWTHL